MKAAVMGAGAWGTTFAQVLCDAGTPATLLCRRPEQAAAINTTHESPQYLPGITLPAALHATSDPAEALDGADLVAFCVPAQSLRQNLAAWQDLLPPGALLVSLMKGIELHTGDRMSQVIAEMTGAGQDRIAVVSGPNLAPPASTAPPWWRAPTRRSPRNCRRPVTALISARTPTPT
jgi:glycerol-3-phosphate dehydrogenase (NAD(P)+)